MTRSWRRRWQRKVIRYVSIPVVAGMVILSSYNAALANPAGGVVSTGSGTITNAGKTMTINQTSNKLGINWNSFSIGPAEKVQFVQPSASSIALNRVTGGSATNIYGSLQANGQVFLVNPNGVLFAPGAQVNVAGLVASTQNITDKNFESGKYSFNGRAAGSVVNQGNLSAADGGYIALLGGQARNEGVIVAQKGSVVLAGGEAMTLDLSGTGLVSLVVDKGAVDAQAINKNLIQADGGTVVLTTAAANALTGTVVNNSGIIRARSLSNVGGIIRLEAGDGVAMQSGALDASGNNSGGTVKVLGGHVAIGGHVDVSGPTGGGTVLIGGNYQGKGTEKTATTTIVEKGTIIDASATVNGNGGKVVVWSDNNTSYSGNIVAQGGKSSGNGGTVEVSGKQKLDYKGSVDLRAAKGKTGNLLLDPTDYTIAASGGDLTGTALATQLEKANVTILSSDGTSGVNGDILVNDAVTWSAANELSLNATRNVEINKTITAGTNANVNIRADNSGTGTGTVVFGGGSVVTNGGQSKIYYNPASYATPTDFGSNGTGYMLVNDVTQLQNIKLNVNANYALGKSIEAAGTNFVPIGDFSGILDGMNKTINGLTVTGYQKNAGLFANITTSGIVRNVGLVNANILGTWSSSAEVNAGAVAGINDGTITNSYSSGIVRGNGYNVPYNQTNQTAPVFTGGLVGKNNGTISNSFVNNSEVTSTGGEGSHNGAAGLPGGDAYVGGLVGYNTGIINYSYSLDSTVSATGGAGGSAYSGANGDGGTGGTVYSGGLVGKNSGNIKKSYSTGTLSATGGRGGLPEAMMAGKAGPSYAGGFAGINDGTIFGSYSTVNVTSVAGYAPTNGPTGRNWNHGANSIAGGFVGESTGTISNSYSTGSVSSTGGNGASGFYGGAGGQGLAAGFVGNMNGGIITNAYSSGTVTSKGGSGGGAMSSSVGSGGGGGAGTSAGFVGNVKAGTITNAYSSGTGSATGGSGGYMGPGNGSGTTVGFSAGGSGTVTASYWDKTKNPNYSIHAKGLTTAQMQTTSSYIGWDFEKNWKAPTAGEYPTLWMKTLLTVSAQNKEKIYDGITFNGGAGLSYSGFEEGDTAASLSGTLTYGGTSQGAKNVGTYTILPSGYLSDKYDFKYVAGTLTIVPKTLTANLTGTVTKTYDGTTAANLTAENYTLAGVVAGDTVLLNNPANGTFVNKNAGAGKTITATGLALTGASAANYTVNESAAGPIGTINPKAITATLTGPVEKVYDGTTVANLGTSNYTLNGVIAGDAVTVTGTGAFADKNVSAGKTVSATGTTLGGPDGSNYLLTGQPAAAPIGTITPASLVVTAKEDTKTYDGTAASTAAPTVTGLMSGDTAVVTQTFASKNAGSGIVLTPTATIDDGNNGGNYVVTTNTNTGTISQRVVTILATTADKVYDGTTTATISGVTVGNVVAGETITATHSGGQFANKNAGAGKEVTISGLAISAGAGTDANNYVLPAAVTSTATITPASLVITAAPDTKTYDGTAASTAAPTMTGLVAGDTATATQTFATKNAGNGIVLTPTATIDDGNNGGNYVVTANTNTGTINPKAITATLTGPVEKVYDGTTAANLGTGNYNLNGVIAGDTVTATGIGTYSDKNAGGVKTVNVTGTTLGGTDAGNYALSSNTATGTIGKITPASLVITAAPDTKTYDGTAASTAAPTVTGLMSGDTANVTQTFASKNAGSGIVLTPSATINDGNNGGNYVVTANTNTGTINQRVLTILATAANKVYDGTTAATISGVTVGNVVAGENISATYAGGAFADKNAGANKAVTISGLTMTVGSGTDANNYVLPATANSAATITPASLVITAAPDTKTYDGTTASTATPTMTGLVAGNTATATQTFATKNAGNGIVLTPSATIDDGNGGANYVVKTNPSTGTITPKTVTASLTGTVEKVYDGTTAAQLTSGNYTLNGVIAGDAVTVMGSGAFADKNAGAGKAVNITGTTLGGTDAGNYVLSSNTATAAIGTITPASLVITAKDYQKFYDNKPFVGGNGVTSEGLLTGDVLNGTLTYTGSSQNATEIGAYAITPDGYSSQNYNIIYRSGTLNINKVPIAEAVISSVVSSAQNTSNQSPDKKKEDSVSVNNSSQIDAATASSGAIFLTIEGTGVNLGVIPTLTMPLNQVSVVQ